VAAVTAQLCIALGMSPIEADVIGASAFFHDVGKLELAPGILTKNGPLTPDERALIAHHCEIGARLLHGEAATSSRVAQNIALWHHQRYDGGGYPGGLVGDEIPLEARIVAVADVYDALRSERPYKPAHRHDDAADAMVRGDDRLEPGAFDPRVLQAFNDCQADISITWDCAALRHLAWRMGR